MKEEKDTISFLILKYGIYIVLGGLLLIKICGYSPEKLIYNYKANREMENILYGGSVYEVNRYIELRNKKVQEVIDLTHNKAKEINTILYYTNDTITINSALIQANRQHRSNYVAPYQIGRNYIAESKETIEYIDKFKEKIDSLGYNVFIDRGKGNDFRKNIFEKKLSSHICIKNVNEEDENKYKVIQLYYYTDRMKQHLTEQIKNRKATWFNATDSTPEKEIALLDEIQFSQIILSEQQLLEQKLNLSGIKYLFGININLSKKSTFYFSCYNKKMDRSTFLEKIELFKTMFLKKQPNIDGEIISVKVKSDN